MPAFVTGCTTLDYPDEMPSTLAKRHGTYHHVADGEDLYIKEFEWPLRPRVLSYFGKSKKDFWNQGIQIQASPNSPVKASRSGTVVFSDNLIGYGSTVIIDHQDDFLTVYANNGRRKVNVGDSVRKGESIADASSGTEKFIYFEIRRRGKAVNPLFYLPKI